MTDITNLRPDDAGIRALERENELPRQNTPATAPAPVRPVGTELPKRVERRRNTTGNWNGLERRSGRDRRRKQVPVLLDTRSHRERRHSAQQTEDGVVYRGIDEIIE